MKKIEIGSPTHFDGYFELPFIFRFEIPTSFQNISNKKEIARSYSSSYDIVIIDSVEYFTFTSSLSLQNNISNDEIKVALENMYNGSKNKFTNFQLRQYDDLIGLSFDGTDWS